MSNMKKKKKCIQFFRYTNKNYKNYTIKYENMKNTK